MRQHRPITRFTDVPLLGNVEPLPRSTEAKGQLQIQQPTVPTFTRAELATMPLADQIKLALSLGMRGKTTAGALRAELERRATQ